MPDADDDQADPLWWYYQLSPAEQVDVLSSPNGRLPADLVERFSKRPGWVSGTAFWVSNPSSTASFTLAGEPARILEDYRAQLDYWWSCLSNDDKAFLIDHRNEELPGEYARKVMNASGAYRSGATLLAVAISQDTRTQRFRLPRIVRIYVEWKARERQSS